MSSAPKDVPSSRNWTPATPTLSEAAADRVTVPWTVAPLAGEVTDTVGCVVSGTVTVTVADVVLLPVASRAIALRVCVPAATAPAFQLAEYGDVVSSAPRAAPSTWNWTPATPTLSEAFAVTEMVPVTVEPEVGKVIATAGGVMSLKTVTTTGSEVNRMPSAFRATARKV